jgi:hypothetical protein
MTLCQLYAVNPHFLATAGGQKSRITLATLCAMFDRAVAHSFFGNPHDQLHHPLAR